MGRLANKAKTEATNATWRFLALPFRAFFWLLGSVFAVLADQPRIDHATGKSNRSARSDFRLNAGAVIWLSVPALLSFVPSPWLAGAHLGAAFVIGRRVAYLKPDSRTFSSLFLASFREAPLAFLSLAAAGAAAVAPVLFFAPNSWLAHTVVLGLASILVTIFMSIADRLTRVKADERRTILNALRVILSVPEDDTTLAALRKNRAGEWTLSPVPMQARAKVGTLETQTALVLPDREVVVDLGTDTLTVRVASRELQEARRVRAESDGLVEGLTRDGDMVTMTLAAGISPTKAEAVQAYARTVLGNPEAALIEWDAAERHAVAAILTPEEAAVRARLAQVLKIQRAWDLKASVTTAGDRIDEVTLHKVPAGIGGVDRDERLAFWKSVTESLPSGTNGWSVEEDDLGAVTLSWGPARALPKLVSLESILPDQLIPENWSRLPLGLGERHQITNFDLKLGPHVLVVGPTGSGKTILLNALIAGQLARGHRVVILDAVKKGVDFAAFEPYTSAFGRTIEEVQEILEAAYAEGQRRVPILLENGAVKWSDLPESVRERERVHPLSIVIDEVGSLLAAVKIPSSLPKDHPKRAELEERALQKDLISVMLGSIARELRFVGVHLVIALQRPDANILSGEMRSNLTSICQLSRPGKLPKREALAMVFDGDDTQIVADTLRDLDDGRSPGLGVVAGDGGEIEGLRVAFAEMRDIPALLEARGVPYGMPLDLEPADFTSSSVPAFGEPVADPDVEIVDLGQVDLDFDLDDFESMSAEEIDNSIREAMEAADEFADILEEDE